MMEGKVRTPDRTVLPSLLIRPIDSGWETATHAPSGDTEKRPPVPALSTCVSSPVSAFTHHRSLFMYSPGPPIPAVGVQPVSKKMVCVPACHWIARGQLTESGWVAGSCSLLTSLRAFVPSALTTHNSAVPSMRATVYATSPPSGEIAISVYLLL